MSMLEDWYKTLTGGDLDLSDVSFDDLLKVGGTAYISSKFPDGGLRGVKKPPVGYQGKVDRLTKVREQVDRPFGATQGRRAGLLSAVAPEVKTMADMDFAGTDFTGMTPEEVDAKKKGLLAEENARLQKEADDAGVMQGDMYARGEERRPGQYGRRYFTDSIYAKTPEAAQKPPSLADAQETAKRQRLEMEGKSAEEIDAIMASETPAAAATGGHIRKYAGGGIASMNSGQLFNQGYYLGGKTDGMADQIPARINGKQEARLSDGEFVIPADVVSHLGNGNSDAGAQELHNMMDNVRTARTGNPEQGKQIEPQKFMPKMAQGGLAQFAGGGKIKYLNEGGNLTADTETATTETTNNTADGGEMAGTEIGTESSLSDWAGDYVTSMLAKGRAEAESPYQAYTGPLTAGTSALQDQAFTGIQALNNPLSGGSITNQMGAFDPTDSSMFMNPYQQQVIDRTAADMQRQDQINQLQQRQQLASAGAFGGSRDALLRAEAASNLSRNIGDMAAEQRAQGFNTAMDRAQQRQQEINKYGLEALAAQGAAGQVQRDIASEGIAADYAQFREERDYDPKMVQYMQSLLQNLPITAASSVYSEPSELQQYLESIEGIEQLIEALGGYVTPAEETTQETTQ